MYLKMMYVAFGVLLLAKNIFAMDMTSENAKNILDKALELQRSRSYTATIGSEDRGIKLDKKIIQRLNQDGSVYYREESEIVGKKKTSLEIKNQSGSFYIGILSPDAAIKYNYLKPNVWDFYFIYDQYADYTIQNDAYNNFPCYKITKHVEFNKKYYNIFLKATKERYNELPKWADQKAFEQGFPTKMVFYIGKDNNFIYSKSVYNPGGKLLSTVAMKNVDLNPILPNAIFALPPKITIQPVNSRQEEIDVLMKRSEEYASTLKEKYKKSLEEKKERDALKPSFLKQTGLSVEEGIFSNVDILSSILFWGAVLVILFAVIYKIKQKAQGNKK